MRPPAWMIRWLPRLVVVALATAIAVGVVLLATHGSGLLAVWAAFVALALPVAIRWATTSRDAVDDGLSEQRLKALPVQGRDPDGRGTGFGDTSGTPGPTPH